MFSGYVHVGEARLKQEQIFRIPGAVFFTDLIMKIFKRGVKIIFIRVEIKEEEMEKSLPMKYETAIDVGGN
jgi:hypothetical protein